MPDDSGLFGVRGAPDVVMAPQTACLAVPIRPTTIKTVHGTDETGLLRAHQIPVRRGRDEG